MYKMENPNQEDDEEEEEDQDYHPESESSDEDVDITVEPVESCIPPTLSRSKQQAVDEAFDALFHGDTSRRTGTLLPLKRTRSSSNNRQERILKDIFGGSKQVASQLLQRKAIRQHLNSTTLLAPNPNRSIQIMQTELTVEEPKKKMKQSGLDSILSKIDAPEKMSTLTKTNMDWEQFKDEEGLEDELKRKAQGKDAFLLKQDFLQRVDSRRFEQEKAQRDMTRNQGI